MNKRAAFSFLLFLASLVLVIVLAWIAIRFALPRPEWVTLGRLEDYPPSEEPYPIRDVYVFLVNDGKKITVLAPMNPAPGGVNVRWNSIERSFIDPLRGTWFDIYGIPKLRVRANGVSTIVETQGLARYEVKIEDGLVYINLRRSQITRFAEKGLP